MKIVVIREQAWCGRGALTYGRSCFQKGPQVRKRKQILILVSGVKAMYLHTREKEFLD
jgi:hypothetical protein